MGALGRADLAAIKERVNQAGPLQTGQKRVRITVHMGTCGIASGAQKIHDTIGEQIARSNLADITVTTSGCMGICCREPLITVEERGKDTIVYEFLTPEKTERIFKEHLLGGVVQRDLAMARGRENDLTTVAVALKEIPHLRETSFFSKQKTIALRNRGAIDAENIDEYIARDGYQGVARALFDLTPEQVIDEVKKSGLRGRGGAGFPTGLKWSFAAKSPGDLKYILCNADEGDPGAFMDRSVLEGDPHAVLEGMIIGAYAIGARQGYIYCRAEYPLAVKTLNHAISQAREYGLLGNNILGSPFRLDIEVYLGAGAFVCGEETALMGSIEGRRGMPRPRPPFPASQGLWNKPSVLNNVETYACIGQIITRGGNWFASFGTEGSKGTKVFALTGAVNNVGLVEVPMGTPIGDIIFDIGGGIRGGKNFKAAQLGGPSGGCIPASALNTPTDYEEIVKHGAIMGSGGLIVMDENTCMVDTARFFMEFCQEESCGKCTPCREGTKRMLEILTKICNGKGEAGDIELLEEMAPYIKDSALCGLGQTAPNPVLSTLRYFRHEYEEHILEKKCAACVCSALFKSPCQHACPIGMDVPGYIALVRAGRLDDAYRLLKKTNPFPAVCGRVCPQFCAPNCRRGQLDEPMAIAWLKRYITDNVQPPSLEPAPITRKETIAVIGAGPAGLTAARDLILRGYRVTVFEELPQAGGMMRYAIPEYRLPRDVLAREIDDIRALGVEIKTRARVGSAADFARIRGAYDCVVLAIGAHRSWKLDIEGETLKGVEGVVEFLRRVNLHNNRITIGKRVAVIGGGNSAIDAARTAKRLGATDVTILYRRERKDMPAWGNEIEAALHEGIVIEYLVAPTKLSGKNGALTAIECARMKLGEFDRSGRRRPVPIEGSTFTLPVDMVIPAISQSPDTSFISPESGIKVSRGGTLERATRSRTRSTADGVFVCGDAVSGPATVVEAIETGHQAAQDVDTFIRIKNNERPYKEPAEEKIDIPFEVDAELVAQPKGSMPELSAAERGGNFEEVELGYTREIAWKEACRCLRCDAELGE
jgi:NADH-quinone oxidoreductase subunit F